MISRDKKGVLAPEAQPKGAGRYDAGGAIKLMGVCQVPSHRQEGSGRPADEQSDATACMGSMIAWLRATDAVVVAERRRADVEGPIVCASWPGTDIITDA